MAARIAVLSEELINQIAAGEVVERPASVVKELCENALDAEAKTVRVEVVGGGLERVRVTDDGHGMSREDALLSLRRHATSKLKDAAGLIAIRTLGFRGEAIPAIASVSRFTLTTAERGAVSGTRIEVEGERAPEVSDAAPAEGTRVEVADLFFNTPARRKFMRREPTERKHCEEAVVRLALARPEVGFFLTAEGDPVLATPAGAPLSERLAAAVGREVLPHLVEVEERRLGIRVHGLIARPSFSFPNARGIYAFVNRRYVRDRGLNAAIGRAYRESLPGGRQPVVLLFIEIDPETVDVNVHPQKMEVRFSDSGGVCEAVFGAIAKGLQPLTLPRAEPGAGWSEQVRYESAVERFLSQARAAGGGAPLPLVEDAPGAPAFPPAGEGDAPGFGQARPDLNQAPPPGYFAALRYLGSLGKRFWICEGRGSTLVVLDPHAAAERIRLGALRTAAGAGLGSKERSLFSAAVELPPAEARAISQRLSALEWLGFDVEPFGGNSFAAKAVPKGLEAADLRSLFTELAPVLPESPSLTTMANALRITACHGAEAPEREPSREEVAAVCRQLDAADFHPPALHGAVVVAEWPFLELERRARGR